MSQETVARDGYHAVIEWQTRPMVERLQRKILGVAALRGSTEWAEAILAIVDSAAPISALTKEESLWFILDALVNDEDPRVVWLMELWGLATALAGMDARHLPTLLVAMGILHEQGMPTGQWGWEDEGIEFVRQCIAGNNSQDPAV